MALAAVIGGPFSRLGYVRRIMVVSAAAAGARLLGIAVLAASTGAVWINLLQYLIPIAATLWAMGELFRWPLNRRLAALGARRPRAVLAEAAA